MQQRDRQKRGEAPSPASSQQDFRPRLQAVFQHLVASGARYDAAPLYPQECVETLRSIGLHRLFAPPESAGESSADARAENASLLGVLRIIGRADLSLGRIFKGHVNALKLFAWFGSAEQKVELASVLKGGAFYGVWATEPPPGVTLGRNGNGWLLTGGKDFATGAGGVAFAIITARGDGPANSAAVAQAKAA